MWHIFDQPEYVISEYSNQRSRSRKGYEKKTHFKEILALVQGRENFDVTLDVVEALQNKLGPELDNASMHTVRQALKA